MTLVAWGISEKIPPQWKIKPGTPIRFSIRGILGTTVNGTLQLSSTDIRFDTSDLAHSSFTVGLDVNSLNTGISMRDSHLAREEYFDSEHYPTIKFRSNSIEKKNDGSFGVSGRLFLKKTEKVLIIPFQFQSDGKNARFTGGFTINRKDFGIGGSSLSMGEIVTVKLDIPVTAL